MKAAGMRIFSYLFLLLLSFSLSACGTDTPETISDLAYGRRGAVNTVYVKEGQTFVPFLVLTDDYNGNTLLLRKEILDTSGRINEYSSYYADSEIDTYLNGDYLAALGSTASSIVLTDLVITAESALGTSGTDTETIPRRVFLLSCTEIGIAGPNTAEEGLPLTYFEEADHRPASRSGKAAGWWLRTPNTYYSSCTYVIGSNNRIGYSNAYDSNGIRPAFCVPNDLPVECRSGIAEDEPVYVFSFENK